MSSSSVGQRNFPKITQEGLEDLRRRIGVTMRTALVMTIRFGATQPMLRKRIMVASSRFQAFCTRRVVSFRDMSVACPEYMQCGLAQTGHGISMRSVMT